MKCLGEFNMKIKKSWKIEGIEWKEMKLGDIGILQYGYTQKAKYDKIGPKFLRITDIDLETSQVNWDKVPYCYIDEKNYAKYKLKDGDILIARIGGTTGKACIIKNPPEGVFASYLIRFSIVDKEKINPEFIYYFTNSRKYWNQIALDRIGKLKEGVNATQLKNLKIPIPFRNGKPDLETQKKIVEYIEANFSRIDKILEKKKKQLEQLDELWESVLEQAFKPKEGEEWREVRLGDLVIEKPRYGLTAKAKDKGKIIFLRITDIDDKGEIKNNSFKFVDLNETEKAKYDIRKGDLLLARSGSVGNFFVAFKDYPDWIYASYLIRFRLDLNKVHLMFIKYFLSSQHFKKWVSYQKRPGAQPNINAKEYSSFKIPIPFRDNLPDIEKQKEIANYLDSVYEKIKALKEKIQIQINLLEDMKESILDEVFNHGEVG